MNAYAQQDAQYERRMSESDAIYSIYEDLMSDREFVRESIVEVRHRNPKAAKGGEFSGLVKDWIMDSALSQFEARSNRAAWGFYA